jgi:peptide/nickel transport system permease protein
MAAVTVEGQNITCGGRRVRRAESPTVLALRCLFKNRIAVGAMAVMLLFVLVSVFANLITSYDPLAASPLTSLLAPGWAHLLGTDSIGRDVFSRILYGGRISLTIGFLSVGVSLSIGVFLGLMAGYFGGKIDTVIMRCVDLLMAFPGLLLALVIVALLGPGIRNVMIAVGIGGISSYARLVRGSVLSLRQELYVEAARCVGAGDWRIILRHILPNAMSPVLVLASMSYGWALLSAAGLSFLGLGAAPPAPEWGAMLSDGRAMLWSAPWATIYPGFAIMIVVLAANFLGDAVRDAFDPRQRY